MICKILLPFMCFAILCCKDPAKVKEEEKQAEKSGDTSEVTYADTVIKKDVSANTFDTRLLIGKWRLNVDSMKAEISRNADTKEEAQLYIKDFLRYNLIEMNFKEDENFTMRVNADLRAGTWGTSSDSSSYWIRLADDMIELHELRSLTKTRLVEFPVAQWKVNSLPVKRVVFNKID